MSWAVMAVFFEVRDLWMGLDWHLIGSLGLSWVLRIYLVWITSFTMLEYL